MNREREKESLLKKYRDRNKELVSGRSWSSLVEGDEELDRPNSQTTMKLCHAYVA